MKTRDEMICFAESRVAGWTDNCGGLTAAATDLIRFAGCIARDGGPQSDYGDMSAAEQDVVDFWNS